MTAASTETDRTTAPHQRRSAAIFAALAIMVVAANLRPAVVAVGPLIDDIKVSEGFSSAAAGLLTTLPVLFFGLVAPIAPRIAARFGIERTVFAAMALLCAAILLRWVPSWFALFAGSALAGVAIGICNVVLPALIKRDFSHRSGLMTGLYSMTLSGGAALAAGLTVPIDSAVGENWRVALASWSLLALLGLVLWIPQLSRVHRISTAALPASLWRDKIAWAITIFMASQSLIFYTFTAWLPEFLGDRGMSKAGAGGLLALAQTVALLMSLAAPIVAVRFRDQRAVTFVAIAACAIGFIGLVTTEQLTVLWVLLIAVGPGAAISLVLLFMVLRSSSTAQTSQVSGMAQSVGYCLAAIGPLAIGALHDATGSWTLSMSVLALALIPLAGSTLIAAKDSKMPV
ncbi:CP family cyanate transporter-like MFS transporter [Williamsia limnetica]|jgi:CP family cyanate transporter-like MFS transporter|uniref:CP family cyanate transporter-like MFS transporter n=1 Tax=Williamsia limnetica TaxID=882452 RepID=A0A318RP83_WILLI|nr:MFS transporter [Williamsia limnetica]PYE19411.1 CP family cyanate transporter-like MFS transporter [Williamsia limnetica]